MVTRFEIGGRAIGIGAPCFVIAEAGVNHDGSLDAALHLVDAAADAGADAVKFQTFVPEELATTAAPKAPYQRAGESREESQLDMLRRLRLADADYHRLIAHCRDRHIQFLSTPFDRSSVAFLRAAGVEAFKIGSGDLTNIDLIEDAARARRPMILSTGMATLPEVERAVETASRAGAPAIALLHCVSSYPAEPRDANLRAMEQLRRFAGVVGYSDHTLGIDIAIAAVALGAAIIEKHLTLDRRRPGPDHTSSLEPGEMSNLVAAIRRVELALGHGRKEPAPTEAAIAAVARKSIIAAVDIPSGTALTRELLAVRRPGTGLPPTCINDLVGRRAARDIAAETLISLEMLT